jgi:uncharacterized membrane protein
MLQQVGILVLLTCLPLFELRFSIPVAILSGTVALPFGLSLSGFGWEWYTAFAFCSFVNILLGPAVFFGLELFTRHLLRFRLFEVVYNFSVRRARRRVEKYVGKYGTMGVALFIGVPLPGSGSYTGALGAYVLGLTPRQFFTANVFGVLIAGTLVTLATVTGKGLFGLIFG